MKRTALWFAIVAAGFGLYGCRPSEVANESTEPATVAKPAADTAANPTPLADPADSAPDQLPDATVDAADEAALGARANSAQAQDPLLEGIEIPQLVEVFSQSSKDAEENPQEALAQVQFANALAVVGQIHTEEGRQAKADEAILRAAEVLDKLIEANIEIPKEYRKPARTVMAQIYYREAATHSRSGNAQEAFAALNSAVQQGFSDFEAIEQDEEFAAVRAEPDYAEQLENWRKTADEIEAAAKAEAIAEARQVLESNEPFPFDFSLTDVHGTPMNLADHQGKVVIVDIWGTWCGPCVREIPAFIKLQETYGEQGFQMLGLSYEYGDDDQAKAETVRTFLAEHNVNYPSALVDDAVLEQVPELEGFPTTLFLDRSGKVRAKVVGAHDYEYLEGLVLALLEEPAADGQAPEAEAAEAEAADAS